MRFMTFVLALTTILASYLILPFSAAAQSVTLATGEWAPFVSEQMEGNGFTAEIVQQALQAANMEPKLEFYPWARCEQSLESGDATAAFPYAKTAKREEKYIYSEPIAMSRNVLFFLPQNMSADFDFTTLTALKDYKVGGVRGNYYEKTFNEAGISADYTTNTESCVKKLYMGRIELMPENELVGWQQIKATYPDEIDKFAATTSAMDEQTLHLIARKEDSEAQNVISAFNKGLAVIKENGVYDAILKKYGLQQ